MELQEIFTCPFTTPTTCYSIPNASHGGEEDSSMEFATESHILKVDCTKTALQNKQLQMHVGLSSRTVLKDAPQLQCVGYSKLKGEEAMALIDPVHIVDEEGDQLLQPDRENDGVSVLSTNERHHHRRVSSTISTVTTSSMTAAGTISSTTTPHHQKNKSEISAGTSSTNNSSDRQHRQTGSMETIDTTVSSKKEEEKKKQSARRKAKELLQQSKARLVFTTTTAVDHEDGDFPPQNNNSLALLDYRPLCPCVAQWDIDEQQICGAFVGSADDSVLRFYRPTTESRTLEAMALPEEHFSVDTPVMALDFLSVVDSTTTTYILAIACQDGTVQLVTWDGKGNDNNVFGKNISSHKIIVDGPLVCIKLHYDPQMASLRVIVGSLCGYVCQLIGRLGSTTAKIVWKGPFIICEGLWNDYLDEEDSVLSIDVYDNYVAVGTRVGRCILYATRDNIQYFPVWYSLLPYCIHGVRIIQNDELSTNPGRNIGMLLAVTTRRSFHLFQALEGRVDLDSSALKIAESTEDTDDEEEKLLDRTDTEEAKAAVKDILGDILSKVEEQANTASSEASAHASGAMDTILDRVSLQTGARSIEEDTRPATTTATAHPQLEYSSSEDGDEAMVKTDDVLIPATSERQAAMESTNHSEVSTTSGEQAVFVGDVSEIAEETATTSSEEFVLVERPIEEEKEEAQE